MARLIPPLVLVVPLLVTLAVAARTWLQLQRGDARASNEVLRWQIGASVFEFSPRSGSQLVYVLLRGVAPGLIAFGMCVVMVVAYLVLIGA